MAMCLKKKPKLSELKGEVDRGARVVQSVKHPTLGFGSDHDLMVREFKPAHGACLGFSLSLTLYPSPTRVHSLSQNKL